MAIDTLRQQRLLKWFKGDRISVKSGYPRLKELREGDLNIRKIKGEGLSLVLKHSNELYTIPFQSKALNFVKRRPSNFRPSDAFTSHGSTNGISDLEAEGLRSMGTGADPVADTKYLRADGEGYCEWSVSTAGNVEGTDVLSTGPESGTKFLKANGSGGASWAVPSSSSGMSNFVIEDNGGTEVTVTNEQEMKFNQGDGLTIAWNDVSHGSDSDPYDLDFGISDNGIAFAKLANLARGSILTGQGGTSDTLELTVGGSGTFLKSDGTDVAWSTASMSLTSDVTGILPTANGGTNRSSAWVVGDLAYASATNTLASITAVASGNVLRSAGTGTAPAWGQANLATDVTGVLPVANGGTMLGSYCQGAVLVTQGLEGQGYVCTDNATINDQVIPTSHPTTFFLQMDSDDDAALDALEDEVVRITRVVVSTEVWNTDYEIIATLKFYNTSTDLAEFESISNVGTGTFGPTSGHRWKLNKMMALDPEMHTNGVLLIGGESLGPNRGLLNGNEGIAVTNGDGTIQLDVDLKSDGGLAFESDKLALSLSHSTIGGVLGVTFGGTGVSEPTDHYMFVGSGASAATMISPSTSGYLLTSNGTGSDPAFEEYPGSTAIHTIGGITNDIVLNVLGSHGDRTLGVYTAGSGDDGDDLTIYAGGVSGLAPGDMDGGNLILKSGAGDGTGTSNIQFWAKETATDAALKVLTISKPDADEIEMLSTTMEDFTIKCDTSSSKNVAGNSLTIQAGYINASTDSNTDGGDLILASGSCYGTGTSHVNIHTNARVRWTVDEDGVLYPSSQHNLGRSGLGEDLNNIYCQKLYYQGGSIGSDRRLKKDIVEETFGVDFINKLKPVTFRWNEDSYNRDQELKKHGFIAQDLEELCKGTSIVEHDQEVDRYGVDYIQFIAPLVKSVQELSKKVESLEKQLEKVNKTK